MRQCGECRKSDRPQLDISVDCSCGAKSPDPSVHEVNCRAVVHEVVRYPVRMSVRDLTFDRKLPAHLQEQGWELWLNGDKFYRVKMLCRDCIGRHDQAQERKRDYLKACKAARGVSDQTYAQMLASQDF